MRYLILDDEPLAHALIDGYCQDLGFMHRVQACTDPVQALGVLTQGTVDLLFLDLEMPRLKGFDLLRSLTHPPVVVVVTAHAEFALQGYDLDVCDYLLKPFSLQRFLQAIQKAQQRLQARQGARSSPDEQTLFVRDAKQHHQVALSDIRYVEACGNYAVLHVVGGEIVTQEKISALEQRLPASRFVRTHRSYIVAVARIQRVSATEVEIEGRRVPVGRTFKAQVSRLVQGR